MIFSAFLSFFLRGSGFELLLPEHSSVLYLACALYMMLIRGDVIRST